MPTKLRHLAVLVATVTASCLVAGPAWSLEGVLTTGDASLRVIVWRDEGAHSEGLELISAGVHKTNPALLAPLIACLVAPGTRAVTTDAGFITHDIMVIEGPNAGCRGNIPIEHLRTAR
jgi:hypothetical protein